MKLKISRHGVSDLSNYFIPFMLQAVDARIKYCGQETIYMEKVCKSILSDLDISFKRKLLTSQSKFNITLTEAEGIILTQFLLHSPIRPDDLWRHNLRNQIIDQLDKQI